jgi:16S rRNA (cytosine967-C5)-methyltransferase
MATSRRTASPKPTGYGARAVATHVLHRVMVDQAFAARVLDTTLAEAELDARDARLATEIVYGTLRTLPLLDAQLDAHLARGRPDPYTLAALRAAAYQARYLSRIPDFAIVQETVSLVKEKRGQGLGKLANAVLRRLAEERPRPEDMRPPSLAVPSWIEQLLVASLGEARTRAYLDEQGAPPLTLRLRAGVDPDAFAERLRAEAPDVSFTRPDVQGAMFSVARVGDPRKLPGYAEGQFAVQDAGAALVGQLLGARPGERVLDACSGRGGKTLQLLEAVGPTGHVTAVDVHERKLDLLREEAERLGLPTAALSTETIDLSVGNGGLEGGFDRVLVDAPCTGLGTLRRRPEITLRLGPKDPIRMAQLQLAILKNALGLVRPGGILVFAVCSPTHAEGRDIARTMEGKFPQIRRLLNSVETVALSADDDGVFRVGPWPAGGEAFPDIYQVVRWEVLDRGPVPR